MDINLLHTFSATSANDEKNTHLWVIGASLIIPQLNRLLEKTGYQMEIGDVSEYSNDNQNLLGDILRDNRSDKSTTHNYHIIYSHIFNLLQPKINVLEIGLGTNNPDLVSSMGSWGRPGASLYAFRDYLPEANIFGADIDTNILFTDERINTCFVDQLNSDSFQTIINSFGSIKYDLIIDDGLHSIGANFNTLLFALDNLNDNGWIVIEDIHKLENMKALDFILKSTKKYMTKIVKTQSAYVYLVNKL